MGLDTTKVPDNSDLQYVPFPTGNRTFIPRFSYRSVFNPEAGDPADGNDGADFAARIMLNGELGHKIGVLGAAYGFGTKTLNAFNILTYPASDVTILNLALTSLADKVGTARDDGSDGLLYARITHIDGSSHGWNEADRNLVQENGGAEGTPLAYLTGQIAESIQNDESMNNVRVLSSAYLWSLQPPTQLMLPDNAGVSFAPIEANWALALDEGNNAYLHDYLTGWADHTSHIWSWLYSTNFAGYLQPLPNIYPMIDNIKLFANVPESEGMFIQDSYSTKGGSFAALHAWVYARLMWDPALDGDQLVQEFCNGYYGPDAGPIIHEYIQKLHQSAAQTGDFIGIKTRPNLPYLNARFIIEANRLMQEAEDNAASSPLYLKHVQIERMGVDWVMLLNYAQLQKEAQDQGLSWPDADKNDRLARLDRLRATINEVASMDNLGEGTGRTNDILDALQQPAVVPENICPQIGLDDASCLDFQDIGFALSEASITSDQNASDHRSAFISGDTVNYDDDGNGTGVWGIQVSLQTLLPANSSEKWDIFARVRIEINRAAGFTSESDAPAFKAGISPGDHREYPVREFGDEQYHIIKLVGGSQNYNAQKSVWFSPPDKQRLEPSSITNLYVDRVFAIKHITPSNIFQLRYFMLFDDDAVMSDDPLSNETYVARMNSGHTVWAIQTRLSDLLPDERSYDIYASIRLGQDAIINGTVINLGVNGNGINNTKAIQANELSSSEYRLIKLPGTNYNRSQVSENGENPKIWFQPASETSGVFYIDKLTIVPVDDQGNSQITLQQASAFYENTNGSYTGSDALELSIRNNLDVDVYVGSYAIYIEWDESDLDANYVNIYRDDFDNTVAYVDRKVKEIGHKWNYYLDQNLNPSTKYHYQVEMYLNNGSVLTESFYVSTRLKTKNEKAHVLRMYDDLEGYYTGGSNGKENNIQNVSTDGTLGCMGLDNSLMLWGGSFFDPDPEYGNDNPSSSRFTCKLLPEVLKQDILNKVNNGNNYDKVDPNGGLIVLDIEMLPKIVEYQEAHVSPYSLTSARNYVCKGIAKKLKSIKTAKEVFPNAKIGLWDAIVPYNRYNNNSENHDDVALAKGVSAGWLFNYNEWHNKDSIIYKVLIDAVDFVSPVLYPSFVLSSPEGKRKQRGMMISLLMEIKRLNPDAEVIPCVSPHYTAGWTHSAGIYQKPVDRESFNWYINYLNELFEEGMLDGLDWWGANSEGSPFNVYYQQDWWNVLKNFSKIHSLVK